MVCFPDICLPDNKKQSGIKKAPGGALKIIMTGFLKSRLRMGFATKGEMHCLLNSNLSPLTEVIS